MRKIYTTIIFTFIAFITFAQTPQKMSYQAVVRNTNNHLITNTQIGMQVSIIKNSPDGTVIYSETHVPSSNANGLVDIEIGGGDNTIGQFNLINWSNGTFFVKTEIDPDGADNYSITGTSQLLSVPFAIHSKSSEYTINDLVNDADSDPNNEIQDIVLDGNNISITDGSTIDLSTVMTDTKLNEAEVDAFVSNNGYITDEVDGSTTNEIQDLQLVGNILTITNNGSATTIDLSPYLNDTNTQLTESQVDAFTDNNGYLTAEVDGSVTNEIELPTGGSNNQVLKTDGSGNYAWVDQTTNTQLTESQVDAFTNNNGYLTAEVDASVTNEIELPTGGSNNQVLKTDGSGNYAWVDQTTNTNTQLTESQVDAFTNNNGYLTAEVDGSVTNEIELPSQSGHSGKVLITDGSSPSWTSIAAATTSVKTISANTTLTDSDHIVFINGPYTAFLPATPSDGQEITMCSTNSNATINTNGKIMRFFGSDYSSLSVGDLSQQTMNLVYSATMDIWFLTY